MSDYKPSYTWPASVPFRLFYESGNLRVFIIENVQHNWNWLSECAEDIRPTDYFFVIGGWYQSESFASEANQIFSLLNLRKQNFFMMYNSPQEKSNFEKQGFQGDVINHNAWLKEKQFGATGAAKKFDAGALSSATCWRRR
ncbi:hypothetical protein CKO11_13875 [Rhodobacter sp. TJ_12]|uniref:hypothetical protein n=1 Tax=Rhodobacter sp. TJ_12 TaxID=2029399 RepID=UPI001CBC345E|nr:hypothetical protein [Rhodobacter sp. TJ_12]MBZ4023546.1 hypothetical protein [Rhodobacter sp. TJ_12]